MTAASDTRTGFDPARDGAAASQAFADHYQEVRGYVQSRVGDPHTAEDLASEAFLRGLRSTAVTENPAALHKKIAHDLMANHWRTQNYQRTWPVADLRDRASDERTPEEEVVRAEEVAEARARLDRGLDVLTPAQREVVMLGLDHPGLSMKGIAAATARTKGAVDSLRHRAFEAMRRAEGKGVEEVEQHGERGGAITQEVIDRSVQSGEWTEVTDEWLDQTRAEIGSETKAAWDLDNFNAIAADHRQGQHTTEVAGTEWVWTGRGWEAPDDADRREQLASWHADDNQEALDAAEWAGEDARYSS